MILVAAAFAADTLVLYDLETDDGGFVVGGDIGAWSWGTPSAGPGAGWSGQNVWATSPDGVYFPDATETLTIPIPSLEGRAAPALRFYAWWAFGAGDYGWIEVDDGGGWALVEPVFGYPGSAASYSGASTGWTEVVVSLADHGPNPSVRLVFAADADAERGAGWFVDEVGVYDGDVAAPSLSALTVLTDTMDVVNAYPVSVTAVDDTAVQTVTLRWSAGNGEGGEVAMAAGEDGVWLGAIPAQAPGATVTYDVVADDGTQVATSPSSPLSFRVYLPAPTNVEGPAGRVLSGTATLRWRAPEAPYPVEAYEIWRDSSVVAEAEATDDDGDGWLTGEVPLEGEGDRFVVVARFATEAGSFVGDPSEIVEVDAVVPTVDALMPAEAYAGDTVRVELRGQYLLLTQDQVDAHLGTGVVVTDISVEDVDTAWLSLSVSDTAEVGARSLTLSTPSGTTTTDGLFSVLSAAERPKLVTLSPEQVQQGESTTLTIQVSGALGSSLVVDLGEGMVVESVTAGASDGETTPITVQLTCLPNATIGTHAVSVDDGTRVMDGLSLEVEDRLVTLRSCSVGGQPRWFLGLLALLALRRRR